MKSFALLSLPLALSVLSLVSARADSISFQEDVTFGGTYQTQATYTRSADFGGFLTATRDGGSSYFVGQINNGQVTRALLGFDLTSIPAGVTITSATLTLTSQDANGETTDEEHSLTLHELFGTFQEENVSYTNRDETIPELWATPGGDFNAAVLTQTSGNPFNLTEGSLFTFPSTTDFVSSIQTAVNGFGSAWFLIDSDSNYDPDPDRGLFRFYSDDTDPPSKGPKLDIEFDNPFGGLDVTVDRTTGEIKLKNNEIGALLNVRGYSVTSASGALDTAGWMSIADNSDADSGTMSVDGTNVWTETSNTSLELSEGTSTFPGSSTAISPGQEINLGSAWLEYFEEDVLFELLLDDGNTEGQTRAFEVEFVQGTGGFSGFEEGDLNFDGVVNESDFLDVFVPAFLSDTSGMSLAEAYRLGDMNGDGLTDIFDFTKLNRLFKEANPGAASLVFPSGQVPEPNAFTLVGFCLAGLLVYRVRSCRFQLNRAIALRVLAGISILSFSSTAVEAVTIQNLTTNTLLFFDDYEISPNGVSSAPFLDATDDYDPVVPVGSPGTWQVSANFDASTDELPEDIQVTNVVGELDPGPFQGSNYLRAHRSTSQGARALGFFASQMTNGDVIRLDTMFTVINHATGNGGGIAMFDDSGDAVISVLFRGDGTVRNIAGNGFGNPTTTSIVPGLTHTLGEWSRLTFDFTVGGSTFDLTVDGTTVSGLDLRYNAENPLMEISAFHINGSGNGTDTIYADLAPELSLQVNQESGLMTLKNDSGVDLAIDTYRVRSATPDAFVVDALTGLDGNDYDGVDTWTKLASTTQLLNEAALGDSTISNGASIPLGTVYNTTTAAEDLILEFHLAGSSDTLLYSSLSVVYGVGGQTGDHNGDGLVNAADYVHWRDQIGNGQGYTDWQNNFGAGSGSGAWAAPVPEPASAMLLLVAIGFAFCIRGRRA